MPMPLTWAIWFKFFLSGQFSYSHKKKKNQVISGNHHLKKKKPKKQNVHRLDWKTFKRKKRERNKEKPHRTRGPGQVSMLASFLNSKENSICLRHHSVPFLRRLPASQLSKHPFEFTVLRNVCPTPTNGLKYLLSTNNVVSLGLLPRGGIFFFKDLLTWLLSAQHIMKAALSTAIPHGKCQCSLLH